MTDTTDEFHHCPQCRRRTRHRVSKGERKLAPVLWCQTCFHVHMGQTQSDVAAAERAA
jgi:ribosomal protein L37AE/L43A